VLPGGRCSVSAESSARQVRPPPIPAVDSPPGVRNSATRAFSSAHEASNPPVLALNSDCGAFRLADRVPSSAIRAFCSAIRVRNKAGSAFAGDGLVFHSVAGAFCSAGLERNKVDQVSYEPIEGFCMVGQRPASLPFPPNKNLSKPHHPPRTTEAGHPHPRCRAVVATALRCRVGKRLRRTFRANTPPAFGRNYDRRCRADHAFGATPSFPNGRVGSLQRTQASGAKRRLWGGRRFFRVG